jgi:hypothetical protein
VIRRALLVIDGSVHDSSFGLTARHICARGRAARSLDRAEDVLAVNPVESKWALKRKGLAGLAARAERTTT